MRKRKLFIFSNLATSVDGKIATASRELFSLGSSRDHRQMEHLRAQADAVLFSGEILRLTRVPCGEPGKFGRPVNVVMSQRLEGFDPNWKFFTDPDCHRILLVTHKPSVRVIRRFTEHSVLIWLKPRAGMTVFQSTAECLEKIGIRRLLVEGGAKVMAGFCESNLIDEFHVTITPRILGGKLAPTLVDGIGLSKEATLNLELKSVRRAGSELFLVYETLRKRGVKHPLY